MAELPALNAREVIGALQRLGFSKDRQKGAHVVMTRPGHPNCVTVPVHGAKNLKKGTLRAIIRDAGVSVEEFREALD
jgi:predicted RNA binding protein YcfA (HicA-like mRNA interferase family)